MNLNSPNAARFEEVLIGPARLILGDCMEVLPTLPRVDAVVTDPPYGIAFAHGGNDRSGIGKGAYATKFAKEAIAGDDRPFDPAPLLALNVPSVMWGGQPLCRQASRQPVLADLGQARGQWAHKRLRRLRTGLDQHGRRGTRLPSPLGRNDEG